MTLELGHQQDTYKTCQNSVSSPFTSFKPEEGIDMSTGIWKHVLTGVILHYKAADIVATSLIPSGLSRMRKHSDTQSCPISISDLCAHLVVLVSDMV